MKSSTRIAVVDIENAPNSAFVWGKYEQNVLAYISEWHLLSFSVKWRDTGKVEVYGLPDFPGYKKNPDDDFRLARKLWEVYNDADIIIGHNSNAFDNRKANARFAFHNLGPPSPYKTVDTLKLARKYFFFNSNKLGDLATHLGVGAKVKHEGFELWQKCMAGDTNAWKKMKRYNRQDVIITNRVYDILRSWDQAHPNINLSKPSSSYRCPVCGTANTILRGWNYAKSYRSRRYQCMNATCGRWSAGAREKVTGKILL